jgi:hypothetical protein
MATPEEKREKGARNQSLFRDVNEKIEQLTGAQAVPTTERWDFLCECANRDCTATMSLTMEEYEAVRRVPTHFPILVGHDDPEIERVVRENDRYAVVEKFGEAGKLAVTLDPRRRTFPESPTT